MHTTPPHIHIEFIFPRSKGIGSRHTRDNQRFNLKESHSKRNELSSLVKHVPPPMKDLLIHPTQLSSVR